LINKTICSRHAYGGLWAYYKSSLGSPEGILFWEKILEENMDNLHASEVISLTEAFNENL